MSRSTGDRLTCTVLVMRWLRHLELLLLTAGTPMLAFYGGAMLQRSVLSKAELRRFEAAQSPSAASRETTVAPDFSLWSNQRIKDYQVSMAQHFSPSIGILRIPRINIEVPVLEGTDDLSLNRGVGHVVGTAYPGKTGNIAIAGHRDGFFRGLKDIVLGDTIVLVTSGDKDTYIVNRLTIVAPTDVSVLATSSTATLTLITCYPFYYMGSAPKRYIVQASIARPRSM
jgi:sortase A